MERLWRGSAYCILSTHVAFTLFIMMTPFAILIGQWKAWPWTQNLTFRTIHLLLLTFVILEVLLSIPCFLTTIENSCRKKCNLPLYSSGFFDYWVRTLFAINYREWMFTSIFSLISVISFILYFTAPPLSS